MRTPAVLLALLVCCDSAWRAAAAVDVSKLPPAAVRPVDFARDIKPILENSCFRCHGTDRPRGRFSLASRQSALRGGDEGVDIIPGDSANSRLIHYVAHLVPDFEMPPPGKGDPLTREQISLLRAWIDQGVGWDTAETEAQYRAQFSFVPAVRWTTVDGNAKKFQEHQWIRRGFAGGVADFRLADRLTNDVVVVIEGRALTDEYRVTLDIRKQDAGFARLGFEQFRRFYDDHALWYQFPRTGFATGTRSMFELDRDLHLDTGRAFVELGLTRPDLPRITLGYEYQYKSGTKSTEQFGPVSHTASGTNMTRHTFPAWKDVDENVHIVKLDLAHDIAGVHVENHARAEFWDLETTRANAIAFPAGQSYPAAITITRETHDQWQFANALHGEKAIAEWLFVSAGYLFTRLSADAGVSQATVDGAGRRAAGVYWNATDIVLEHDSHVFNVNAHGGPWNGFTAAVGVQPEFSHQKGFGDINLREGDPNDPTVGVQDVPGFVRNDIDKAAVDETVVLRYTAIPMTVLFAEARLKQEAIGQFEEEFGGGHDFLRDTDATTEWQEYRAGFNVSPWRHVSWNAGYKYRRHESEFDHRRDAQPHGTYGQGYSAFIRSRDSESSVVESRLVVRPATWLKTTFTYQLAATDYRTTTDPLTTPLFRTRGGSVFAGNHDASSYSANVTVTPWRRLHVGTTLSYQQSRITTADHGSPAVASYDGDTWSVLANATFALSNDTDVSAGYSVSFARYAQPHAPGGLPLGIDYDLHSVQGGVTHRVNTNITATLQYGFFKYVEPTSGGFNDYTAHMVFGAVAVRLP